jgi:peptide chain release factor 2
MLQDLLTRLDALRAKINEAWDILKLDETKQRISDMEAQMSDAHFWSDQEKAKLTMQVLAEQKKSFDAWNVLRMNALEMDEMIRLAMQDNDHSLGQDLLIQLEVMEKMFLKMEFELLFSGDHDASNAIVSIHAGAGGTDAQDWAEMLLRMVFRFCERKEWRVELLDESRGGEAGIKSATFIVKGRYAYGYLKSEHGVHRLVRQSPFNADALRQTSFALIEVIPEVDDTVDIDIKPDDLRIDTFMSGGKGGQSVNTTYSAVRIVHIPTGITVACQNERSQTQNKETAMKILRSKLITLREQELQKEKQQLRGEFKSAEWGNQIRSYVLHPYKMVKDHRTDAETADPERVLGGDLDMFMEAYLRWSAKEARS